MSAVHHLLLHLRKVFETIHDPLGRSLRRLLQLWRLVMAYLFSWESHRKPRKVIRCREGSDRDSTIVYASQVPTQLSRIIGRDTPTLEYPTPRVIFPSYNFPSTNITGSSLNLNEKIGCVEGSTNNYIHPHRYLSDQPRPPSRASSQAPSMASYRNSHMGAEQSALRDLTGPRIIMASRSGSPVSLRPIQSANTYLEQTDYPLHCLLGNAANLRAHSMVNLQERSYQASISGRARSSSPRPMSRATPRSHTPITLKGDLRHRYDTSKPDVSPYNVAVDPEPSPSCPCSAMSGTPEIKPCTTVGRYDRNVKINPDDYQKHIIPSLTTSFAHEIIPGGWIPLAHPEGALYWVHEVRPIYTDAYLCNLEAVTEINRFLQVIDRLIEEADMPLDWELVLELAKDEKTDERIWAYYFVNHETRTLFWLHDFDADMILSELRGVKSKSHIYHQLQSHYWTHWETFPHNREVPPELYQELMGILVHSGIDSLTSPVSTSVYSVADLQKLIRLIQMSQSVGGNHGYAACVTGRMMSFFANARFLNFYGQEHARLSRNQPIFDEEPRHRSALMLLSALLFFAPEVHLRGLEGVYVDWIVCAHVWSAFIGRLQTEWREFTLYAAVLLIANVAFLAIPSVGNGATHRSSSQIVSYISVATCMGSVVLGLLLIRQHRNKIERAHEVDAYLKRTGLETLAIIYSLPYSLLMWSIICFFIATLLESLLKPSNAFARILVIIAWALIGALAVWCVSTGWEWEHPNRYPVTEVVRSCWMSLLRSENQSEPPTEEGAAGKEKQTSWFRRVLLRRSSARSSTLVGSFASSSSPGMEGTV